MCTDISVHCFCYQYNIVTTGLCVRRVMPSAASIVDRITSLSIDRRHRTASSFSHSATPKIYIQTISSSSEHFSKFWPPYWIRHFEFRKSDTRFGFNGPKNLCTATFTNILLRLSEAITNLYFFKIFKWKIIILKMITTFMMKTKSILSNYTIFVHQWLKKVWSFLAIPMWKNNRDKIFFAKLSCFLT